MSGEILLVASDRISVLLFLEKKRRKIDKKLRELGVIKIIFVFLWRNVKTPW